MIFAARGVSKLPTREALTSLLLNRQDIPERLKAALQFVDRYEGPSLLTYTDMVDYAQQAGILHRFNPGHVNAASDLDPLEARHLLQIEMSDFEEEIRWLEEIVTSVTGDSPPNPVAA
jgi:hypothetical protein